MKASEINPTSWLYGLNKVRTPVLMRRWANIRKNVRHMEDTMLALMNNPQTTPEQLSLAATMYADMTNQLYEVARSIDEYIYFGKKPESGDLHMLSCASRKTGKEDDCNCKDWEN